MRLVVVVASGTGRTLRLAEAVVEGAKAAGADTLLRSADEATPEDLLTADAIVLGSGVHMGGIESGMRAFFERAAPLWLEGSLRGKLGAAFVTAGLGARGGGCTCRCGLCRGSAGAHGCEELDCVCCVSLLLLLISEPFQAERCARCSLPIPVSKPRGLPKRP